MLLIVILLPLVKRKWFLFTKLKDAGHISEIYVYDGPTRNYLDHPSKWKVLPQLSNNIVLQFSCSEGHALACCGDGSLYAWGDNDFGQLGNSDSTIKSAAEPQLILQGCGICGVSAGSKHSVVVSIYGLCL